MGAPREISAKKSLNTSRADFEAVGLADNFGKREIGDRDPAGTARSGWRKNRQDELSSHEVSEASRLIEELATR
jgi:hypothetical protein